MELGGVARPLPVSQCSGAPWPPSSDSTLALHGTALQPEGF